MRQVVEDGEAEDDGERALYDGHAVEGESSVRLAYGQVAVGRDEDRRPDRGRLSDEQQRVGEETHVHPRPVAAVAEAGETEDVSQREVKEPEAEEEVVGDGQRLGR